MRRFAVLLSVVVTVLLSSAVVLSRPPAAAQEATASGTADMASHPVVGGWRLTVDLGEGMTSPDLQIFHADGTYTEILPDHAVLVGVWQPTGERTATLTLYENSLMEDRLVQAEGRFTVEVDESGNTLTEAGTFVGLFEDGSVAIAFESPATGTRMEVLPMEPLGTPVFPADPAAAGTPTP
jgi:hypothetical protein